MFSETSSNFTYCINDCTNIPNIKTLLNQLNVKNNCSNSCVIEEQKLETIITTNIIGTKEKTMIIKTEMNNLLTTNEELLNKYTTSITENIQNFFIESENILYTEETSFPKPITSFKIQEKSSDINITTSNIKIMNISTFNIEINQLNYLRQVVSSITANYIYKNKIITQGEI